LMVITKDRDKRSCKLRTVIRYFFRLFLFFFEFLGVVKFKTKGIESLQNMRGKLVICNHPSLLDVVILMAYLKKVQCVVNSKLWSNFFVGIIVRVAGYIRNDSDPLSFLHESKRILAGGENIIIFPEGTRSIPGQKIKMTRGVANLALNAEVDIQALLLNCSQA